MSKIDKPRREKQGEADFELDDLRASDDPADDAGDEDMSPDQVLQRLGQYGQLDPEAPAEAFVELVLGAAFRANGRRVGVLINAGSRIDERLILPEPVLGNSKTFQSWLNDNGFTALLDVLTESNFKFLVGKISAKAQDTYIVLEREGLTRVKGSGVLIASYAGQLFAPEGLEEKLSAPPTSRRAAGNVSTWNEAVAPHLVRAPVLLFAVGLALTPAFFGITEECLGFELVGPPGALDERIVAAVAVSVGDHGNGPYAWVNAKEALAGVRESGRSRLLALDDIGDDDRRYLSATCGDQQFQMGAPDDRSAAAAMMVVGTPWKTAGARLKKGDWRSSHELGMVGIPTPRMGSLASYEDEIANIQARINLTQAVLDHHGCLMPELLRAIVQHQEVAVAQFEYLRRETLDSLTEDRATPLTGIEARVAARFAIVGATLEFAIRQDVLRIEKGSGSRCVAVLFGKWLSNWRLRDGNIHRAAAECLQAGLRRATAGLPTFEDECKVAPVGFRGQHDEEDVLFIYPEKLRMFCDDFDWKICLEAAEDYGFLKKAGKGKQLRKRLPTALVQSMGAEAEPVVSFYAFRVSFLDAALG